MAGKTAAQPDYIVRCTIKKRLISQLIPQEGIKMYVIRLTLSYVVRLTYSFVVRCGIPAR